MTNPMTADDYAEMFRNWDYKQKWQIFKKYCETSYSSEFIKGCYQVLDSDNELEWWVSIDNWWSNNIPIALLGWFFSIWAFFSAFAFLFNPAVIPSLNGPSDWYDTDFQNASDVWNGLLTTLTFTAGNLIKPDMFFISQIFTVGTSNLS